jgi:DNA-binding NtrC family response regulator
MVDLAKTHYPSKTGPPAPDRLTSAPLVPGSVKHHSLPSARDAHVAALRVLAVSLLKQIETIEEHHDDDATELNLHDQVQQFEAALILSALEKTGGRQRRAARLLGVKVTTLNTKIKRLRISAESATRTLS